jgi:signal transduction histidine kinase
MLRTATWLLRAAAIVVVGVATFTKSTADHRETVVQITAYAAGVVLFGLWRAVEQVQLSELTRQRLRAAVLASLTVCSAPTATAHGSGLLAFALIAVISAGSETSLMTGWTVLATGALAIEIGAVIVGTSTVGLLESPLLLVAALLAGHNRRAFRVQAQQSAVLLERSEQLRTEQRQVAVLDERTRIAREIHDVLAHSLGALSIQIQTARALLSDQRDVDLALANLDVAQRMVSEGLTETRRAVHALRTDSQPLTDELALLVDTHRQRHQVAATLDIDGDVRELPAEARLALVRATQESLVNAAKHSAGEPIAVRLAYDSAHTTVTITNPLGPDTADAAGFDTIDGGYGLVGMRERIRLLDGSLTAGPDDGRWAVTAMVPQ